MFMTHWKQAWALGNVIIVFCKYKIWSFILLKLLSKLFKSKLKSLLLKYLHIYKYVHYKYH